MFRLPPKKIIINRAEDLLVLENNPVAASPVTVIGEGTSRDDFDGWSGTNFVQLLPHAYNFTRNQLVKIQKTLVKADSVPYVGTGSPNFNTPVAGSVDGFVLPDGSTIFAQSVTARRPSPQTSTLTVNAVPAVGSVVNLTVIARSTDRNSTDFQQGYTATTLNIVIKASLNTPTLIAARIAAEINLLKDNALFPIASATAAGAVVTLVGKTNGVTFDITQDTVDLVDTELDITVVDTVPAWLGVNDFYNMEAYNQTVAGMYDRRTYEDVFLPIKGVFYTSYFITYRLNSGIEEHQADSINVEQSHLIDLKIFVNPALTGLITKLDLIGGF